MTGRTVRGRSRRPCPQCDGLGVVDLTEADCAAAGIIYDEDTHQSTEDCDECGGTGRAPLP